jgi:hypothetical protein
MIVVHPGSELTPSGPPPEQRITLDDAKRRLVEPSEGSRQRIRFVVYYGAVTSA